MNKKKHIILSYIFTVLGVIVGAVSLMLVISIAFSIKTAFYPLVGILSFLVAALLLFSQIILVITTVRYRKNSDYQMPVIPVAGCVLAAFVLYFLVGGVNSAIQEKFILPNANKLESMPTGLSEDFSYFDVSVWDFETVLRYRLHVKGYDSERIEEYDGDQEGFEYVIHLYNGDDILISSIDDPLEEVSMLAEVKYMINTPKSDDDIACNAFVSAMGEMFIKPFDQEASNQLGELNSEHIGKLIQNDEGSFTYGHMTFSYESIDSSAKMPYCAIKIAPEAIKYSE